MSRMGMGQVQRADQRQTQQPNPRLYQTMDLLYMPLLDLQNRLEQELSENPFLELSDPDDDDPDAEAEGADDIDPDSGADADQDEAAAAETEPEVDWDEVLRDGFEVGGQREQREVQDYYETPVVGTRDLRDHLGEQLGFLRLGERERWIADEIVGNIDDDGMLSCALEDVADGLNATRESLREAALANANAVEDENERAEEVAEVERLFALHSADEVESVLDTVQRLDPPGVGARDLRECLLLQLEREERADSLAAAIVSDHFDGLARHLWTDIARALEVTPVEVQDAADEIARLDPRPGRRHSADPDHYVIPDLIVDKIGGEYLVFANDAELPRLRIARAHREVAADRSSYKGEAREFITTKLNAAQWLIQVIEQRRQTMLGVMRFIVDRQIEFFEKGVQHLKPLTLREVAEHVGLAESTVSRVANQKYVQSPAGVHPLRYFFSGAVSTSTGKDLSRRGVVARVQSLIQSEDPHRPLTDDAVVRLLRSEGVKIARRTVAKYRDQLGILPARMRKRIR